jgi:Ni/Co efflux regulator RcnB/surface antigen
MKRLLTAIAVLGLFAPIDASADRGHGRDHDRWDGADGPPGLRDKPYNLPPGQAKKAWRRGERIPMFYVAPQYYIDEPRAYRLAAPPRGHRWIIVDGDAYLVEVASGLVADFAVIGPAAERNIPPPRVVVADEREDRWRHRYARTYTVNDDPYYRECHRSVDPAAVIAGGIVGGVLGNALGHGGNRTAATVAGVVIGGAAGAAMTSHLDCEDRGFAYKTYADGFNAGRPNSSYRWRNPDNGHYGEFQVGDYYKDPDGFRCAKYTQKIYIDGRPQAASGRACQQPDGTWAVMS